MEGLAMGPKERMDRDELARVVMRLDWEEERG